MDQKQSGKEMVGLEVVPAWPTPAGSHLVWPQNRKTLYCLPLFC